MKSLIIGKIVIKITIGGPWDNFDWEGSAGFFHPA
jgi:hypothetical protein